MKTRVITAVALLAVLAVAVWQINTPILLILVAFLSAAAAFEIMKCANVQNMFIRVAGVAFAALTPFFASDKALEPWLPASAWSSVTGAVPHVVLIIILVLAFFAAMLKGYSYTTFEDVAVSFFASVIIPWGFSLFIRLRDMFAVEQFGIYLIFYALICALATDSGAQLMGMAFGKHKMSPNISPKKTIEGAVGGIIFSIVLNAAAMILYNRFAQVPMDKTACTVLLAMCVPVSFMGMMGDLSASVLKRNFKVKDFGNIFPGHGGVMDRFDSTMFTLPITYILAITVFS